MADHDEQCERPTKIRKLSHASNLDRPAKMRRNSSSADGSQEIIVSDASDNGNDDQPAEREAQSQAANSSIQSNVNPISKNQLKKLKKREEWEAGRPFRKAKRKQKVKEKRERKKATKEERRAAGEQVEFEPRKPRTPIQLPITLIVDCGFDDLMMEKEYISLGSQLTRSYSDNSRTALQAYLVFSSWGGKLKHRFDTTLSGHYKHWKAAQFFEENFVAVAEKAKQWMADPTMKNQLAGIFEKYAVTPDAEKNAEQNGNGDHDPDSESAIQSNGRAPSKDLDSNSEQQPATSSPPAPLPEPETIYLTADSPHTLTTLNPNSIYIIGGLVDKNRHKGICYRIANEHGIKTAKLPIGEFMEMQSRSVLATNHVVEIMLKYLGLGDWGEAFCRVIPKRKGGVLKVQGKEADEREESGDDLVSEKQELGEAHEVDEESGQDEVKGLQDE